MGALSRKTTGKPATRRPASVPISLRFSPELRERVRRYASERHLQEATAIRALCAERLNEIELATELAGAEEWQLQQATRTWDRFRAGKGRTAPPEELDRIFDKALPARRTSQRPA